jgi:hypothetical protein
VLDLELSLLGLTVVSLVLGSWAILWARSGPEHGRALWGRYLFVGTLLFMGGTSLVAAFHRAEGLVPLGLLAGMLVVGMLWEGPQAVPMPEN